MFKGNAKTHFQVLGTGSVGFMMSPFGDDRWDLDDREKLRKIYKCTKESEINKITQNSAANAQGNQNKVPSNNQLVKPTSCHCVHQTEIPQGYVPKAESAQNLQQPSTTPPSEPATNRLAHLPSQQQLDQLRQQASQQALQHQCQQRQQQLHCEKELQQQQQQQQQQLHQQLQQQHQQHQQHLQQIQQQQQQQQLQQQQHQQHQQLLQHQQHHQHLQQINKNQVCKNQVKTPEICGSVIRHRNGLNDEDVKPKSRMKYTQPTARTTPSENANQTSLLCMNCYNANQKNKPS